MLLVVPFLPDADGQLVKTVLKVDLLVGILFNRPLGPACHQRRKAVGIQLGHGVGGFAGQAGDGETLAVAQLDLRRAVLVECELCEAAGAGETADQRRARLVRQCDAERKCLLGFDTRNGLAEGQAAGVGAFIPQRNVIGPRLLVKGRIGDTLPALDGLLLHLVAAGAGLLVVTDVLRGQVGKGGRPAVGLIQHNIAVELDRVAAVLINAVEIDLNLIGVIVIGPRLGHLQADVFARQTDNDRAVAGDAAAAPVALIAADDEQRLRICHRLIGFRQLTVQAEGIRGVGVKRFGGLRVAGRIAVLGFILVPQDAAASHHTRRHRHMCCVTGRVVRQRKGVGRVLALIAHIVARSAELGLADAVGSRACDMVAEDGAAEGRIAFRLGGGAAPDTGAARRRIVGDEHVGEVQRRHIVAGVVDAGAEGVGLVFGYLAAQQLQRAALRHAQAQPAAAASGIVLGNDVVVEQHLGIGVAKNHDAAAIAAQGGVIADSIADNADLVRQADIQRAAVAAARAAFHSVVGSYGIYKAVVANIGFTDSIKMHRAAVILGFIVKEIVAAQCERRFLSLGIDRAAAKPVLTGAAGRIRALVVENTAVGDAGFTVGQIDGAAVVSGVAVAHFGRIVIVAER